MSDPPPAEGPRPAPPTSTRLRVTLALGFLALWLAACVADWFRYPDTGLLPAWFQALGVLILGYLLGLDFLNLIRRGAERR